MIHADIWDVLLITSISASTSVRVGGIFRSFALWATYKVLFYLVFFFFNHKWSLRFVKLSPLIPNVFLGY